MVQPHVKLVDIADVSVTADTGTNLAGTGITIPEDDAEALIAQIGDFKTSVFQVSRLTDLEPAVHNQIPTDANRLPLSKIGVSGFLAGQYGLGLTATNELLIATAAAMRPIQVTVWYLRAVDIAAADLQPAARARLLPEPTEETRGRFVYQDPDSEAFVFAPDGVEPPDPAEYQPRFTSIDAVIRALRIAKVGSWADDGVLQTDLRNTIAAAENQIIEWAEDDFQVADTNPSARNLLATGYGVLETDYYAAIPAAVEIIDGRTSTTGTALEAKEYWPLEQPTAVRASKHLEGNFVPGWYRVTARWGWPAVPYQVKQAAELLASRLAHRQIAPLGLVGADVPTYVSRHDNDVRALLAPFMSASLV